MYPMKAYYLDLKNSAETVKNALIEKRKSYEILHQELTKEDKHNKVEGELAILDDYLKEYKILEGILDVNIKNMDKHFARLETTLDNIDKTIEKLENLEDKSFDKVDFIGKTLGF